MKQTALLFLILLSLLSHTPYMISGGEYSISSTIIHGNVTWVNQTVSDSLIYIYGDGNLTLINSTLRGRTIYIYAGGSMYVLAGSIIRPLNDYYGLRTLLYGSNNVIIENSTLINVGGRRSYAFSTEGPGNRIEINGTEIKTNFPYRWLIYGGANTRISINNTIIDGYYRILTSINSKVTISNLTVHQAGGPNTEYPGFNVRLNHDTGGMIDKIRADKLLVSVSGDPGQKHNFIISNIYSDQLVLGCHDTRSSLENISSNGFSIDIRGSSLSLRNIEANQLLDLSVQDSLVEIENLSANLSIDMGITMTNSKLLAREAHIMGSSSNIPLLVIEEGHDSVIYDSTFEGGSGQIILYKTMNVTINNTYIENGISIIGEPGAQDDADYYRHNIRNVMTRNGMLQYIRRENDISINATGPQVFIIDSKNVTIEHKDSRPITYHGPLVVNSTNTTIKNTIIFNSIENPDPSYPLIGVYSLDSQGITISDFNIDMASTNGNIYNVNGIFAANSMNITLLNGSISTGEANAGVYMVNCGSVVIKNVTIASEGDRYGVMVDNRRSQYPRSTKILIKNVTVHDRGVHGGIGIEIDEAGKTVIRGVKITATNGIKITAQPLTGAKTTISDVYILNSTSSAWIMSEAINLTGVTIESPVRGTITCYGIDIYMENVSTMGKGGEGIIAHGTEYHANNISLYNIVEKGHAIGLELYYPDNALLENITLDHGLTIARGPVERLYVRTHNVTANNRPVETIYNESNMILAGIRGETILLGCENITINGSRTTNLTHQLLVINSSININNLHDKLSMFSTIRTYYSILNISSSFFWAYNPEITNGFSWGITGFRSDIYLQDSVFNGTRVAGLEYGHIRINNITSELPEPMESINLLYVDEMSIEDSLLLRSGIHITNWYFGGNFSLKNTGIIGFGDYHHPALYVDGSRTTTLIDNASIHGKIILSCMHLKISSSESIIPAPGTVFYGEEIYILGTSISVISDSSPIIVNGRKYIVIKDSYFGMRGAGIRLYGGIGLVENTIINNTGMVNSGKGLELYASVIAVNLTISGFQTGIELEGRPEHIINSSVTNCQVALVSRRQNSILHAGNTIFTGNNQVIGGSPGTFKGYYLTITDNIMDAIYTSYGSDIDVHKSTIMGNHRHGVLAYRGMANVTENYWGSSSGPEYKAAGDPDDPEEVYGVYGTLSYTPYLQSRPRRNQVPPHFNTVEISSDNRYNGTITLSYIAQDDEEVMAVAVWIDDELLHIGPENDVVNIDTSVYPDGYHILRITAYDYAGNTATLTRTLFFDNLFPVIELVKPINNSIVSGTITLSLNIYDADLQDTRLLINGSLYAVNSSSTPLFDVDTRPFQDGKYVFEILSRDHIGHTSRMTLLYVFDNTPPSIVSNIKNGTMLHGIIHIEVNSTDANPLNLSLYRDNHLISAWSDGANHTYYLNTSILDDGTHTIQLVAFDKAGNVRAKRLTVFIDNNPPTIGYIIVAGNDTWKEITLNMSIMDAFPDKLIVVVDNETVYFGDYSGALVLNLDGLELGIHRLLVFANDTSGHTLNVSYRFIVRLSPLPETWGLPLIMLASVLIAFYLIKRYHTNRLV